VDVEFDPAKDTRNHEKHGVPLLAGIEVIQNRVGEERDDRCAEPRFRTCGLIRDKLFVCVWSERHGCREGDARDGAEGRRGDRLEADRGYE
jgi:uncharacterized DUF497 family protein